MARKLFQRQERVCVKWEPAEVPPDRAAVCIHCGWTFKAHVLPLHEKYVTYLQNAGSVTAGMFDEDWDPVGASVRAELLKAGLVRVVKERLQLRTRVV